MTSARVGFVFLRGAVEGIFAGGLVASAGHTRLSVRFALLSGLIQVVFVGGVMVGSEGTRLSSRSNVASVHALGGAADILGCHALVLGPVIFSR